MSPIGVLLTAVGVVLAMILATVATIIVGFRTGNRTVLRAVRRFNRRAVNPRQLQTAGRAGERTSVIRHRGSVSGRPYSTPIGAVPTDDGFVVSLPYGPEADWVRNVRAAGSALLEHDGRRFTVDRPEIVPIASTPIDAEQPAVRLFGIRSALRLRATAEPPRRPPNGTTGIGA